MSELLARKTASDCGFKRLPLSLPGPQEKLSIATRWHHHCPGDLRTSSFAL